MQPALPTGRPPQLASGPIPLTIIPLTKIRLFSTPPQKSLTLTRSGKSTTCVESSGKRRVKAVSKWEKLLLFSASCPPFPTSTRFPAHFFPPLPAIALERRRVSPTVGPHTADGTVSLSAACGGEGRGGHDTTTWVTLCLFRLFRKRQWENCWRFWRKPLKARNTGVATKAPTVRGTGPPDRVFMNRIKKCYLCPGSKVLPMS